MSRMPCLELQIIVALWLKRNEREVTLKAYSDHRNVLKDVPWTDNTTLDQALQWCKSDPVRLFKLH